MLISSIVVQWSDDKAHVPDKTELDDEHQDEATSSHSNNDIRSLQTNNQSTITPSYQLQVDADQDDRAIEIKLWKFGSPHMLGFHLAWFGFFVSFCLWFAIAPLLNEIKKTLHLTKQQVWNSNIVAVTGTVLVRFLIGPLVDKYGPRICMSVILVAAAFPTALTGLIHSGPGLVILRFFIGISGSAFVACQYWCSRMFAKQVVGTANAISAGWGVAGGGVTQLIVGSLLFPLFKYFYRHRSGDDRATMAWRTVCIVPAFIAMLTACFIYKHGVDSPQGNFWLLKKKGSMSNPSATKSLISGILNFNTWLLFLQYGCCFGVELTMYNATALYFHDKYGKSTETAAAIASIFGWFNIFSRGLGGYISDVAMSKYGMRGRLVVLTALLILEGALVMVFANMHALGASIAVMSMFAILVQACNGAVFGIVPYIDPANTGSQSGLVGAGGNAGAIWFGLLFKYCSYQTAFTFMGAMALGSSLLSLFVFIPGHAGLVYGRDDPSEQRFRISIIEPTKVDGRDEC